MDLEAHFEEFASSRELVSLILTFSWGYFSLLTITITADRKCPGVDLTSKCWKLFRPYSIATYPRDLPSYPPQSVDELT